MNSLNFLNLQQSLDIPIVFDEQLLVLAVAAFLGGIIRGYAGFGLALLLVPALTLHLEPRQAVAIGIIVELPVTIGLLPIAVRVADRATVLPMTIAVLLAVPAGALALVLLDDSFMKIAISIVVLLMVAILMFQRRIAALIGRRGAIAAGIGTGLVQGGTATGGPFMVTALMARGDPEHITRANIIAVATVSVLMSVATFALYGLLTPRVLVMGAVATPFCLLGVVIGVRLFKLSDNRAFRGVVLSVLAITALLSLGHALVEH